MAQSINNQASTFVKRERSANFSMEERDILIHLVIKYKEIIENKQSDVSTWKKKETAWVNIENEFNSRSGGHPRTSKTLRIKYEGLKRTVRKKCAALRSELYRTGGGTNTAVPLDVTEEKIKSLIILSATGMQSNYDSDVLPPIQDNQDGIEDEYILIPEMSPKPYLNESSSILQEGQEDNQKGKEFKTKPSTPLFNEVFESTFSEIQPMPSTSQQTADTNNVHENNGDTTPNRKKNDSSTPSLKWDVTSRRNLKTRKHPALQVTSVKNKVDEFTQAKMELVELQIKLAQAELIEKSKEAIFRAKQRELLEEELKLKIQLLKKELDK